MAAAPLVPSSAVPGTFSQGEKGWQSASPGFYDTRFPTPDSRPRGHCWSSIDVKNAPELPVMLLNVVAPACAPPQTRLVCAPPHQGARSSAVEHYLDMVGVTGSIPVAPTK